MAGKSKSTVGNFVAAAKALQEAEIRLYRAVDEFVFWKDGYPKSDGETTEERLKKQEAFVLKETGIDLTKNRTYKPIRTEMLRREREHNKLTERLMSSIPAEKLAALKSEAKERQANLSNNVLSLKRK